jgi:hypothetical protein
VLGALGGEWVGLGVRSGEGERALAETGMLAERGMLAETATREGLPVSVEASLPASALPAPADERVCCKA